jgi:hypothetical protein
MPQRLALFLFAIIATVVAAAPATAQTFVFHLRGDQESPSVSSAASGGCIGQLNQGAAQFSLTCVHNVVGATVMHIHRAAPGDNGPIVFDLGSPASPVTATWTAMSGADITDLITGNLYINIHTAGRPTGEIRGQILTRTVDVVPFTAGGGQAVPPNGTSATANCSADLDANATSLDVQCTHNLASPAAAHLHEGPAGTVGPAIFTFPSAASPLAANVPLTPVLVADFAATFLYLDIHSPGTEEDPGDEIRGQIGTPPAAPNTGAIVIAKRTFPIGGTGFGFSETMTSGTFSLDDLGTRTFNDVTPGTYTVTEGDPATTPGAFTLADLSCDDANSSGNVATRAATIRVEAGEIVRCTFRNFATNPTDELFVFHLSGDQETPPIATTDRGGCMGRFDSSGSELSLVCTHDVASPTLMHIHRAPAGTSGPIIFDLGDPTTPVVSTWSGMTPADIADLHAGNLYVNVHTSGRPDGAIRGQILPRTVDAVAFSADSSQVVPPGASPSSGNCNADLDAAAEQLVVGCTHNVPAPDQTHVHQAPRGENGPVVFTFPSPDSPMAGNVPMTPRLVADFAGSFLYVDIHGESGSEETAPDEIRGQIAAPVVPITTGTIHIIKTTSPAGGTGFTFTDNIAGSPGTFTLDDGETETFTDVPVGTYTVTEADPAGSGFSLTDVVCTDNDSTGNPFARNATIRLEGGEAVTCTFRNLHSPPSAQLFVFQLAGANEVPPNNSTARGGCFGQLNVAASSFSVVCTHNVFDVSLAHIHRAPAGANGSVVFDLDDPASPIEATWTGMTPGEIADLVAGNYYLNIHAGGRPDGEIRGQIVPRTVDSFSFPMSASQEVPPTDSNARGQCFADLADDARSVLVECSHNTFAPTNIHLHSAPPGDDGPVVYDFDHLENPFAADVPLTPRLVADFAAGFLYVNIHTAVFLQGEIRGQLIAGAAANAAVPTLDPRMLLVMAMAMALFAWWRVR